MGKRALIVCSLYGIKADKRDFWHHLRSCMGFSVFKSNGGEPHVCMRPAKQKYG